MPVYHKTAHIILDRGLSKRRQRLQKHTHVLVFIAEKSFIFMGFLLFSIAEYRVRMRCALRNLIQGADTNRPPRKTRTRKGAIGQVPTTAERLAKHYF